MRLLRVGDIIDTDGTDISDDVVRDWIAQGFAERTTDPLPEPEEEEINRSVNPKGKRKKP